MGKRFVMSGVTDWLRQQGLEKGVASIEEKIKAFKKTSKETLRGSKGEKWQGMSPKKT